MRFRTLHILPFALALALTPPAMAAPVVEPPAQTAVANTGAIPLSGSGIPLAEPILRANLSAAGQVQPVTPSLYWRLDKTGRLLPEEVLSPAQQSFFSLFPTADIPRQAGTSWFRMGLNAYDGLNGPFYLDLNSRVDAQIPSGERVWLATEGMPLVQLSPESPGLFRLPDTFGTSEIFVRTEGLPAVGFAPTLRSAASLTVLDTHGADWIRLLLGAALLLGLLRGILEQREWRMWAALYAGAVLVSAFWGFPSAPDGRIRLLDLPALLAPGVALLLLPHVGRYILRTREQSTLIDFQFIIIGLAGLLFPLLPLLSNHVWTVRYLPLWPLGMLLLVPTILHALFSGIRGSGLFLIICLLPPLGLLGFVSFPVIQFATAEAAGWWASVLSLLPSLCLCASSLLIALAPTPRHAIQASRTAAAKPVGIKTGLPDKADSPLRMTPATTPGLPPLTLDDAAHMAPPPMVDSALPLHNLERRMRGPLDVLLNEIGSLEQFNLPRDLVDHTHRLSRAGRQLALLIGDISSGRHGAPVAVRQKANFEDGHNNAPFDLYEVILQAHNAVAEVAEAKNLALSWFTAPHLARSYSGDGGRLERVLTLLAESAVHATDRGIVQIRVQRLPESNDPGQLLFTVSDTGKGAPPLQRSTIALVQAWELVGPCGGTLNVESGPSGTSIAFSMRFQTQYAENSARSTASAQPDPALRTAISSALRILIVSDVAGSRQLFNYYLDELPHEVREARSVDEALGMYTQAPGALLIFDGDLPEHDVVRGIGTLRAFEGEHNYPLASILALVRDDDQMERLRRAGCTHTLLKPVRRTELRQLALRLAPLPKPRTPQKLEAAPAKAAAGSAAPQAPAPVASSKAENKKDAKKTRRSWSLLPTLRSTAAPAEEADNNLECLKMPTMQVRSNVSAPKPIPTEAAPAANKRSAPPLDIKTPASQSAQPPAAASSVQSPAASSVQSPAASSVQSPAASPEPIPVAPPSFPAAPAEIPAETPAAFSAHTATPPAHSTAAVLDDMVRDAEAKAARQSNTVQQNTSARQDKIRRAVATVAAERIHAQEKSRTAERQPIPWPGATRQDRPLDSPYAPGSPNEWVSEPRPLGSTPRPAPAPQRHAMRVVSPSAPGDSTLSGSTPPAVEAAATDDSSIHDDGISISSPRPVSPSAAAKPSADDLPPPVTSGSMAEGKTFLSRLFSKENPATRPASADVAAPIEWVGEPRPKRTEPAPSVPESPSQPAKSEALPDIAAPADAPLPPSAPAAPAPQPVSADAPALLDPLAPFEDGTDFGPVQETTSPAPSAKKGAAPSPVFKPLLLPGMDTVLNPPTPSSSLELHMDSLLPTSAPEEEIFTLTEVVDEAQADLPVLSMPPLAMDSIPASTLRMEPLDELAPFNTPETTHSADPDTQMPDLRHVPSVPTDNNVEVLLEEAEAPVEDLLDQLTAMTHTARAAFEAQDARSLQHAAARLADTASALGLHGLIDLARCLEQESHSSDRESIASLLQTIEETVCRG